MTNKCKKIVTDCDGALLDWYKGFETWMNRHDFHEQDNQYYSISKRFGIEVAQSKQLVAQFNESAAIAFLEPYKDAVEGICELSEMGYSFDVVTSLSTYQYSVTLREFNLNRVFYPATFDNIYCLDCGADKKNTLERLYKNSGYFWIEDKLENAIHGAEVGMNPILMRHSHHLSENIPDWMPIFDTWSEVIDYIDRKDK